MSKRSLFLLLLGALALLVACGGATASQGAAVSGDTLDIVPMCDEARVEEALPAMIYTPEDSVRIVSLLAQADERPATMSRMEYFGRQLLGTPYVAHTLECDPEVEQLAVNVRELDCLTFVETCVALSLTDAQGLRGFGDFCRQLCNLRYQGGQIGGYASRLHYFSTWLRDNMDMGYLELVEGPAFTARKQLDLHYMTRHPQQYVQLANHPEWMEGVRQQEQRVEGWQLPYIPKRGLNGSRSQLAPVQNGDILAILTTKDGLDTTHLGMAVWGEDGKLHMLHASSVYKKVILDKVTFYNYMAKRRQNIGVAVARLKND